MESSPRGSREKRKVKDKKEEGDVAGGSSTISLGEDNENDMLILRKPANFSTNVTGASAEDILALYGGNTEGFQKRDIYIAA